MGDPDRKAEDQALKDKWDGLRGDLATMRAKANAVANPPAPDPAPVQS